MVAKFIVARRCHSTLTTSKTHLSSQITLLNKAHSQRKTGRSKIAYMRPHPVDLKKTTIISCCISPLTAAIPCGVYREKCHIGTPVVAYAHDKWRLPRKRG
ncbi:hypothetical protein ES288_D05G451800v1 [Gossypium darwinii]|uniref:Uncharacterized protein n=2 Tax=Gossypium TaxID=3633 RepID=A0A5D2L6V3_GOSTO|nr:hypothetical protein ES288_D05G451800v1 [Gossypium darwinii]TYH75031.1 hypothetical protein ES332_D05G445100v1 [Gossypium tomentosum]